MWYQPVYTEDSAECCNPARVRAVTPPGGKTLLPSCQRLHVRRRQFQALGREQLVDVRRLQKQMFLSCCLPGHQSVCALSFVGLSQMEGRIMRNNAVLSAARSSAAVV